MELETYEDKGNEEFIGKLDNLHIGKTEENNNKTRMAKVVAIAEMLYGVSRDKENYLNACTIGSALIIGMDVKENEKELPICYCQAKKILKMDSNVLDEYLTTQEELDTLKDVISSISKAVQELND